jgi:hypothetical protein
VIDLPPPPVLDKVIPWLEQRDGRSRQSRAERYIELELVVNDYPAEVWGSSAGSMESLRLLLEAAECYRHSCFGAALICAHATCEQEIGGRIAHRRASAPSGWERWGLGRLIKHAEEKSWYAPETRRLLTETNENRRGVYHRRDIHAPDSLFTRT